MRSGIKNLSDIVKYVLITSWWPASKLEWYKAIIWSTHTSGMANTAFSFSTFNLNSNESNNMYFSDNDSILCIAPFELGNLFWQRYMYRSLKYWLFKYPAWISFMVKGSCVPILFFEWFLEFCLYLFGLANVSGLFFLYQLSLLILGDLLVVIYLAFDIFLILFLLDVVNFLQNLSIIDTMVYFLMNRTKFIF